MTREIRPQPGPQEAFAATTADVAIYGGAAGGGKSWALVFEAARNVKVQGYAAILFRRTSPEITGGGSIWEESTKLYPFLGGRSRENYLDWRFASGARIEFSHLQHAKDVYRHQSKQYALICFDELTHFEESQFWYLFSRNRTLCGVRPYIRAATNPDPDSWVRRLIDWWIGEDGFPIPERSGVLRWFVRVGDDLVWSSDPDELRAKHPGLPCLSLTFIPAKLEDNPILEKADPDYRGKLLVLDRVQRERLLGGNWNIRAAAGLYFQRSFFEIVEAAPAETVWRGRGWDLAATKPSAQNPDPDWSAGMRWAKSQQGIYFLEHAERFRDGPDGVERRLVNTTRSDGKKCRVCMWQDPGQAGKDQAQRYVKLLSGFVVRVHRAAKDKVSYAESWSAQAERGNVKIVAGHWNEPFFVEAEAFPDGAHDDQIDGVSVANLECNKSNVDRFKRLSQW